MSSLIKNIVIFLVFFSIGFGSIFFYTKQTTQKKAEVRKVLASKSAFSMENAPKNSITGEITSLSGDVTWESRVATEPAVLVSNTKIQQGEILYTGPTGALTVTFPSLGEVRLSPNTEVSIMQALATSFVLSQPTGTVTYTSEETTPISIRSLHMLANITGNAVMTVDDLYGVITISVTDGDVTIAYNNTENISQVEIISKEETATFNDETRETTIE